ncbi:hypothetical protein DSECCO2_451660 [anaerobic digester metagenome]
MEDHLRPVRAEHGLNQGLVLHLPEDGHVVREAPLVHEFHFNGIQVLFPGIEEHELAGPEADDLTAQLGPDGAAGTRHQHHLVREVALDARLVEAHLLAAQQILVAHVAKGLDRDLAAGDIRQRRQLLDADLR